MIRVLVKLGDDSTGFRVSVRAESIERAVDLASEQYPGSKVKVLFPIDPESFFIGDQGVVGAPVSLEMPGEAAG
jgi:hypothetical protein